MREVSVSLTEALTGRVTFSNIRLILEEGGHMQSVVASRIISQAEH